jgi:hypothetical protein
MSSIEPQIDSSAETTTKMDILKARLDVIDKMINMYPQLKKDKHIILAKIVGKTELKNPDDYVLDKIVIDENVYYRDPHGLLLNDTASIVGFYAKTNGENYQYYLVSKQISSTIFKQNIEKALSLT